MWITWQDSVTNVAVNNFKWVEDISKCDESFIKSNNDGDIQYPEHLHNIHNDLLFLPEKMKTGNDGKLVANLHDQTEVIHIKITFFKRHVSIIL